MTTCTNFCYCLSALAGYESALADGKMDVAYSRVMLLGTAGVGKTCLKRSLMQQRWDPSSINSTIVTDTEHVWYLDMTLVSCHDTRHHYDYDLRLDLG